MSFLGVDDRASRSRSKTGRDRSRSRSAVRAPSPPSSNAYGYTPSTSTSGAMPGSFDNGITSPGHEVRSPPDSFDQRTYSQGASKDASQYRSSSGPVPYPADDSSFTMGDYKDFPPHERPGYVAPGARFPQEPRHDDDDLAYGGGNPVQSRHASYSGQYPGQRPQYGQQTGSEYGYAPTNTPGKTNIQPYQYAKVPDTIRYTDKPLNGSRSSSYTQPTDYSRHNSYSGQQGNAQTVDITPDRDQRDHASSYAPPYRQSLSAQQHSLQPLGPSGLGSRMNRLSVSGDRPDMGSMPPPSPLLEAYRGTYQSLSPMPLALRPTDDDDLSDLEPLEPPSKRSGKSRGVLERDADKAREKDRGGKEKKHVTLYDPVDDAKKIAKALNHREPVAQPIIDVLSGLTHDQTWELRKEYKKQVKIQGKGISLPKHLKLKLTGNFGKAAYVTALGRFESEGYWANFWYQSHGSRRELLIESLMGRTNAEIRNIKDEFKDKRYSDSLERCMEKELKMDKFRSAVLMALEERRQEELDVYPPEYVNRDVEILHRSLAAKQGGESAMLEVVVRRSDAHLRRVMDIYQRLHGENFARAALRKSNNLVGEVVAHILNGVINKPARDAILLNHAIKDIAEKNKDDELRYELLTSRLVRIHWDKMHLERVKRAYLEKFRKHLQEDVEDASKGDYCDFMCELAESK